MILTNVWTPELFRAVAELAATYPSVEVESAPVVDLFTKERLR